jgi:hypothetical protein
METEATSCARDETSCSQFTWLGTGNTSHKHAMCQSFFLGAEIARISYRPFMQIDKLPRPGRRGRFIAPTADLSASMGPIMNLNE